MHEASMQRLHVAGLVSVATHRVHVAQLPEHGQDQFLARVSDLIVCDQPRGQEPVAYPHGVVAVVDKSFKLVAQVITHFFLRIAQLFAWIEVSTRPQHGETLKNISVQGAA